MNQLERKEWEGLSKRSEEKDYMTEYSKFLPQEDWSEMFAKNGFETCKTKYCEKKMKYINELIKKKA
jgi:hypothetical protein